MNMLRKLGWVAVAGFMVAGAHAQSWVCAIDAMKSMPLAFTPETKSQNRVVLGKLGQAVKTTNIHAKPGTGRRYYTLKPYEYVVLNTGPKGYFKVLLQNGAQGYVSSTAVARLPYDVTKAAPAEVKAGASQFALASSDRRAAAAVEGTDARYSKTPYKWGGNDPLNGIDCSAFVKYLYGRVGINLPRTAAEQALVGQKIERLEELQQGDRLYFWDSKRGKIGHTGLYLGNGYFVHSSSNNKGVDTDFLTKKWLNMLVAARR